MEKLKSVMSQMLALQKQQQELQFQLQNDQYEQPELQQHRDQLE